MAAFPPPRPLPDPQPADAQEQAATGRRLSSKTRYVLAMETADSIRTEVAAAALEHRSVGELAELLARLARAEANVTVAEARHGLVARLANAASRRLS